MSSASNMENISSHDVESEFIFNVLLDATVAAAKPGYIKFYFYQSHLKYVYIFYPMQPMQFVMQLFAAYVLKMLIFNVH